MAKAYTLDDAMQEFANKNPEQADKVMDAYGYTNSPNRPIAADALQPTAPFKITPAKPSLGSDGALAYLGTLSTQFAESLGAKAAESKKSVDTLRDDVIDATNEPGQSALTDKLYRKEGVDTAEADLKDINNDILAEQVALKRQLEQIEKSGGGLASGQEIETQRLKDASLARQADLAVIQMARQGKFDSAKAIADRAVAALTEAKQSKLETLKFMYQENKQLFTKDEQRAFEAKSKSLEDEIAFERDQYMAKFEQTIKQNDPLYQAQLANELRKLADAEDTGTYEVSMLSDPSLPAANKNQAVLTEVFKNSKVSAGNRTSIGNGLSLLQAAQDLASANAGGKFAGLYPGRSIADFFLPEAFKREKTVSNESLISALDLQTQFWASGAALSDEQTKLVQKMIPTKNDKDKTVRAKVNQLVNYMLSQTSSRLRTDGITFTPERIDLFETTNLLEQASPEQVAALRAEGLLK
jgi:hypothetical protein